MSETFIVLCTIQRDIIINTYTSSRNVPARLMFVPCIIRRSRNNQHNAQICNTALFIYVSSYMFR
jgi:hypothetical protein